MSSVVRNAKEQPSPLDPERDGNVQVEKTTAQAIVMSELEGRHPGAPGLGNHSQPLARLPDVLRPLRKMKAKIAVSVGEAEITIGDLLDAREPLVVPLDRSVEQPVDVLIEGQVVARGTLIAVDDQFAVRITEFPVTPVIQDPSGNEKVP